MDVIFAWLCGWWETLHSAARPFLPNLNPTLPKVHCTYLRTHIPTNQPTSRNQAWVREEEEEYLLPHLTLPYIPPPLFLPWDLAWLRKGLRQGREGRRAQRWKRQGSGSRIWGRKKKKKKNLLWLPRKAFGLCCAIRRSHHTNALFFRKRFMQNFVRHKTVICIKTFYFQD